jgi:hypothetical protein
MIDPCWTQIIAWDTIPRLAIRTAFPAFVLLAVRIMSPGCSLSISIRFISAPL